MKTITIQSSLASTIVLMLANACATENAPVGDWQGTITDSAGITLVHNSGPGLWSEGREWTVEQDLVIGEEDGDDDYVFGRVGYVAVDRHGNFFVLDELARAVKVYDASGAFVRRIGGPGEGPGELSTAVASIFVTSDDTLYVNDVFQKRVNVYDPDGSVVRMIPLPRDMFTTIMDWIPTGGENFLAKAIIMSSDESGRTLIWEGLLRSDGSATSLDTLMKFEYEASDLGTRMDLQMVVIVNSAFWTRFEDGRIGWSALDHDRLFIHGADGTLERIVTRSEWGFRNTTAADRETFAQLYEASSDRRGPTLPPNWRVPEELPAITGVRAGPDGSFWVRPMGEVSQIDPQLIGAWGYNDRIGGPDWDVFDSEGRYLGSITLPGRFRVAQITTGAVIGIQKDDLDIERVVRMRIRRP